MKFMVRLKAEEKKEIAKIAYDVIEKHPFIIIAKADKAAAYVAKRAAEKTMKKLPLLTLLLNIKQDKTSNRYRNILVKNVLVQNLLVSMLFKSVFLGSIIFTNSFSLLIHDPTT
jgi:hypothetical protein